MPLSTEECRRLIDAAFVVMRREATIDPGVRAVVQEAGLSNQAFYRHFASKDALLLAVLADGQRQLVGHLARRVASTDDPREQVERWISGVMAQARDRDPVRHGGAQQGLQRIITLPPVEEMPHQHGADGAARHRRQVGQPEIELGRRDEELLLVAEVAHDQRRVDPRVRGDGPDGGPLVARGGEVLAGRGQDPRLGLA